MEEYVKKGILITCFKSPLGFRFYFKDLNTDYLYNPLGHKAVARGDGTFKTSVVIPYYKTFDEGLKEMKIQANIYLDDRTTKD